MPSARPGAAMSSIGTSGRPTPRGARPGRAPWEPCGCRVKERIRDLTCPSHRVHRSFTGLTEDVRSPEVSELRMVEVLVVTSPACHLCEDALEVLERLAPEEPPSVPPASHA